MNEHCKPRWTSNGIYWNVLDYDYECNIFLDFENLLYGWGDCINRFKIGWAQVPPLDLCVIDSSFLLPLARLFV